MGKNLRFMAAWCVYSYLKWLRMAVARDVPTTDAISSSVASLILRTLLSALFCSYVVTSLCRG